MPPYCQSTHSVSRRNDILDPDMGLGSDLLRAGLILLQDPSGISVMSECISCPP